MNIFKYSNIIWPNVHRRQLFIGLDVIFVLITNCAPLLCGNAERSGTMKLAEGLANKNVLSGYVPFHRNISPTRRFYAEPYHIARLVHLERYR